MRAAPSERVLGPILTPNPRAEPGYSRVARTRSRCGLITHRNARERETKALADKELAAAIHQLSKPSSAVWLANQLVREHRDSFVGAVWCDRGRHRRLETVGTPYSPVAERLGAGRFVAAIDFAGLPVASPPEEMAVMTASMTSAANRSFRGAWR